MNMSDQDRLETIDFMRSIQQHYFPDLPDVAFDVMQDATLDGIAGQALFGQAMKVTLYYGDNRVLEPRYRMGLVPVISHELAHYIDPVDPERIMRGRLPVPMMTLWEKLLEAGYARCSSQRQVVLVDQGQ